MTFSPLEPDMDSEEYRQTSVIHNRIQEVFTIGACVASKAVIAICENRENLIKPFAQLVQRHRSFFSLFSFRKNDLYFSYVYGLLTLYVCEHAYEFCKEKANPDLQLSLGMFNSDQNSIKEYSKIFNLAYRFFLLESLRLDHQFSTNFVITIFSVLSKLPQTGENIERGLMTLMDMTSNGNADDPSEFISRAHSAYSSIRNLVETYLWTISLSSNELLTTADSFIRSYVRGELNNLSIWFVFTPPIH